jgi:hypothetical protein
VRERASARAAADDDHVVVVHGSSLRRGRSARSTRRWRRGAWDG